jgi:RNA polymerase sigma factor (sigma-70 family)
MTSRVPLLADETCVEIRDVACPTGARFLCLIDQYGDFLRRTIVGLCPRAVPLSVDDIEQEARVRLRRALRADREISYPGSYIYKVAVSATIRAIRRASARAEEPLPEEHSAGDRTVLQALHSDPGSSPEALAERGAPRRTLRDAVGRLSENRRLAVGLHLQGMTTVEIGDLMGWTEPKARNLVHRGLKDLRRELGSPQNRWAR